MNDLPVHIEETNIEIDDSLDLFSIEDILEQDKILQEEINVSLEQFKLSLESLEVLEDYHSSISNKDYLDKADLANLNLLGKALNIPLNYNYNGFNQYAVAQEGISDVLNTVAETGNAVIKTGVSAVKIGAKASEAVVKGVIKATDLSKLILDKINTGIVSLAAQYESIAKLVEKRWFGLKQLSDVYKLQIDKLETAIDDATAGSSSVLADIKVKLNTVKLDQNRKIFDKNSFLKVASEDIYAMTSFLTEYVIKIKTVEHLYKDTMKSFTFVKPYKIILVRNFNIFNNDILLPLADSDVFANGEKTGTQVTSRVLIGGRKLVLNHYPDRLELEVKRKDLKQAIKSLDITSVKEKDKDQNYVQIHELKGFTVRDAKQLVDLLKQASEALEKYQDEGIPKLIKDREFFSRVTHGVTQLATTTLAFSYIKNYLSTSDNLDLAKSSMPASLIAYLEMFVKAASLSVLVGMIGGKAVALLVDWLRKYIIAQMFTTMDLQYRITSVINHVDTQVLDTHISVRNQIYRVAKRLASSRVWV